ncbi:tetratricopeptide repeat protein [Agrilactobacillus fermenti]|uniref:tetratricopeptide repeat protein n=1 Tax=Agrilactobacillus fermenti TaxID=2586909 RepID=UPI001E39A015|nr:tetratricopeptide repeat protein [Agrilactobacillus fermenti]MCD2256848.1 tetratricopeptide repeat protein [Agrilactobacillus fermenti]
MTKIIPILPSADLYIDRALKAFEQNNYDKAIRYFRLALSLSQKSSEQVYLMTQLAVVYECQGNFGQAVQLLEQLSQQTFRRSPELWYFLAEAYAKCQNYRASLFYIKQYLHSSNRDYIEEAKELKQQLQQNKGNYFTID